MATTNPVSYANQKDGDMHSIIHHKKCRLVRFRTKNIKLVFYDVLILNQVVDRFLDD